MEAVTQTIINAKDLRNRYQIIETGSGLGISESRVLLFDVMEAHDAGDSIYEISSTFNLTPLQVQTAVDYIEAHRAALEPEFAKAVQRRKEREEYYHQLLEEHLKNRPPLPMTPERAAIYALLKKARQAVESASNAEDSR
jgi:uncharacterized protein (DUF433 family)